MKVIFLDIDGVLNVIPKGHDKWGGIFHDHFVDNLKYIIDSTNAKIVISSTWRMGNELPGMIEMWTERGLPGEVVGVTPNFMTHFNTTLCRGKEIDAYIKEHPEITNYVIIDDDSDMELHQFGNFVMTSGNEDHEDCVDIGYGLTKVCADWAIRILNKKYMKVLFLDHDGVICLSSQWGGRFKKKGYDSNPETPLDIRMDSFDTKAVKILNQIIEETGCEIVVSSDWKNWGDLEQMQKMYITRGIKPPIDLTPNMKDFDEDGFGFFKWKNLYGAIRVTEILEWLKNHPEVTHWVAVDDLDLSKLGNFVMTTRPYNEGIKQCGIKDKILNFLK